MPMVNNFGCSLHALQSNTSRRVMKPSCTYLALRFMAAVFPVHLLWKCMPDPLERAASRLMSV